MASKKGLDSAYTVAVSTGGCHLLQFSKRCRAGFRTCARAAAGRTEVLHYTSARRALAAVLLAAVLAAPAFAQPQSGSADATRPAASSAPASFDGPPAPVPPAVAARDASGKVTLRAVRLERPLEIDGRLDDEIYLTTRSIEDFEQQVPNELRAHRILAAGFSWVRAGLPSVPGHL